MHEIFERDEASSQVIERPLDQTPTSELILIRQIPDEDVN